ncbi:MAG: rhodanese-like domain-containing protein [Planctomycetota bacterium]
MHSTITANEFGRRLSDSPSLRVIDVRTPAEFREVHVAGAENKPLDRLDPGEFGKGPLYVVCRSGGRGKMACEKLDAAGVAEVFNVEGGTLACIDAGIEVVRGKKAMSLERQVRIAAGSLVVAGVALSFLHPAWLGLSAFVGAGLVFAGVTDTCGMGMLIARAPWNRVACSVTPPAANSSRSAA